MGLFKKWQIEKPVISIGNITAGGSGKTPLVEYITNVLMNAQLHPAVVSRGYGRNSKGTVLVSSGDGPLSGPGQGGDEPVQIARHVPGAIVIADEDRVRGSSTAIDKYGAECIVLDDAFQHRRCGRDLDIVVYDVSVHPDEQRLLPQGRLREPLQNLERADAIILSRCQDSEQADSMRKSLSRYSNAAMSAVSFQPNAIRNVNENKLFSIEEIRGLRVLPFCGIGSPSSFNTTLTDMNIEHFDVIPFKDHHNYSETDIEAILEQAKKLNVDCLLTTEKDAMRLWDRADRFEKYPLYSVMMETAFLFGEQELQSSILQTAGSR
jgi:tetraacyldisaccharide 4'-kinase